MPTSAVPITRVQHAPTETTAALVRPDQILRLAANAIQKHTPITPANELVIDNFRHTNNNRNTPRLGVLLTCANYTGVVTAQSCASHRTTLSSIDLTVPQP